MSKITSQIRKHLPASEFGLPKQRAYPMPDKVHAANAKSRATQQFDAGKLSHVKMMIIDRKANKVLGK